MSKKSPIFYSALLLTGVNLLLRMVSTSFQVYISGQIGAAGVGLLQLVLSVGGMAMTAGIAGIRTGSMYLTAEELGKKRPENISRILRGCCIYSLICSGVVATFLYSFAPIVAKLWIGNAYTAPALRLVGCFLPINCLVGVMTGYFTAAGKIKTLAAVEVAEQLISMVVTLLGLHFFANNNPEKACQWVVFGSGAGGCFTLLVLSILRSLEKSKKSPRFPLRRRLLGIAAPLALADDLKAGINTTENLMVPKRLALFPGAANPLAAFGTVCGMVFPVLMFPAALLFGLCELLIPEMARCNASNSRVRIAYLAKRSLRVALLYGCFFWGILYLLAEPLCLQLYDSQDAGYYLGLYASLAPMLYCDAVTDATNKGLGQQKISVRYNILTSLMDVAFLFLLLPKYGMTGYFISFLVTHLVNFLLSIRLLIRTAQIHISILSICQALLATGLSIALSSVLVKPWLSAAAFCLLLPSLLTLVGVVSKEDALWLKTLIRIK